MKHTEELDRLSGVLKEMYLINELNFKDYDMLLDILLYYKFNDNQ